MKQRFWGNSETQKECRAQILLLMFLLLGSFYVLQEYLFGNQLLVFNDIGSDTWQQYVMQYATVVKHLREGNFTLWDFYNGLGTNMLSMNLFDPSLMLLYLLGCLLGTQKMLYFLSWIQVLRILLAGWVFYRYLSLFSYQRMTRFLLAFVYGFNGYLMVWGQHYQFGMVTLYLPLLLSFAEKYLRKEKGRHLFPVMTAVCCVYSVYLSYMSLIVTGFYLLFRLWMMDEKGIRIRIQKFAGGCAQILLGIGMSCAIFLPSAYTMLGVSNRVSGSSLSVAAWIKRYVRLFPRAYYESVLMRLFSSNLQETYQLADGKFELYLNYYEDPILFVSNIALIFAIQMLLIFWRSQEKRRVKAAVYTAAAMMAVCLVFQFGGCVFNAFQYTSHRHTFVLMPFILLAAAWMLDELQKNGRRCLFGLILTFCVAEMFFYIGYRQSIYPIHRRNSLYLAVTSAAVMVLMAAYPLLKKWKWERVFGTACFVLAAVNVLSDSKTAYSERIVLTKDVSQEYFQDMYSEDVQEALQWLKEQDTEFYRVEKDYSAGTIAMDALVQGYCGVSTYNSTLNKNFKSFLERVCPELFMYDSNHVVFWENAQDQELAAFFGVRYLLSKEPILEENAYRLLKQFGEIYVYENTSESSAAHFYETLISKEQLENENSEVLREWYFENTPVKVDALEKHCEVKGSIEADTDGYVMLMIPAEQGWKVTVDGKEAEFVREDLGFLTFEVSEGTHEFTLSFHTEMLDEGMVLSVVFWGIYAIGIVLERKKTIKNKK